MLEQLKQLLEFLPQAVLMVKDDCILWRNSAASCLPAEGTALHTLLENEDSLFLHWNRSSSLSLSLFYEGVEYEATVRAHGEYDVFFCSRRSVTSAADAALVLNAAASLRKPLQNMVGAMDALSEQLPEISDRPPALSELNQSMYQLLRLCGQLSDGVQLLLQQKPLHKESTDINEFLKGFMKKTAPLVASAGLTLRFTPKDEAVRGEVDLALLGRALYNLIANAMQYSKAGSTILVRSEVQGQLFLISVEDEGEGLSGEAQSAPFRQFLERTVGDSRRGLGLGLPMVREIARLHDGSMMIGQNSNRVGTTVTFSLSLRRSPSELRSPAVRFDYLSGFDHGLVELSEVLDAKMYNLNEVQ